jgi:hypothetical protein
MPVEVKDTLLIMFGFGTLLVALLSLVVHIINVLISQKRK